MEKKTFAYRVPIGDYNYLQCNAPWEIISPHCIVQEAAKNRPSFASKNEKDRISVIVKYIFKAR